MKRFDKVVNNVFAGILLEQDPGAPAPAPGLDQTGGPQGMPPAAPAMPPPAAPAPEPAPEEQKPKPLTAPGRAFLVDLVRRALEIDPKSLADTDLGVFADEEVTIENAAEVEKKLLEIINRLNPSKI